MYDESTKLQHSSRNYRSTSSDDDIYSILGIDPNKYSRGSYDRYASLSYIEDWDDDPEAPSGAIFDKYSRYTDNDPKYWKFFRLCTWLGLGLVALIILLPILADIVNGFGSLGKTFGSFSGPSFGGGGSGYVTEEIIEVTEEVVEPSYDSTAATNLPNYLYFKGYIDSSPRSEVTMELDIQSRSGLYYYHRPDNCMRLNITELRMVGDEYHLRMDEYSPHDEYTGFWEGTYNPRSRVFKGTGQYNGRYLDFTLNGVARYETGF